jgi:hypothetical protein
VLNAVIPQHHQQNFGRAPHQLLWQRTNVLTAIILQASHLVDEVADVLPQHHHVDACSEKHSSMTCVHTLA